MLTRLCKIISYDGEDNYKLIEAVDPKWNGASPLYPAGGTRRKNCLQLSRSSGFAGTKTSNCGTSVDGEILLGAFS